LTNCATTLKSHLNVPEPRVLARRTLATRMVARLIRSYQTLRAGRVSPCRFYPSCSEYAVEAVETHGAWRGTSMALRRLARCRPFGAHGVDLVPPSRQGTHT